MAARCTALPTSTSGHALSRHETAEPARSGPPATARGLEHVSTFSFDFDGDGTVDTGVGSVTDVWEHKGFAYVGTFYEPDCSRFGTRIVDIRDPENPVYVTNLLSMPNTRVNDVKVHEIGGRDILAATQEPCFLTSGGGSLPSKGGVVLYDVTDPAEPVLVKKAYIRGVSQSDTNFGVHNTFFWDAGGRTYLGLVDDDNVRDFSILDVTKPERPVEVAAVGWPDWLSASNDPQGFGGLGSFAATSIHDVWVEEHDGKVLGYLSYWDAGLIVLDLTNPASPVLLGDSDYDTTGPEGGATGEEGNSHVAVPAPAEDGRYVLMGDEDFSPRPLCRDLHQHRPDGRRASRRGCLHQAVASYATRPLPAELASAGGELCAANGVDFTDKIALIKRGTCTFQLKAENAKAQGAVGMLVYNDEEARGDDLVLMGGDGIEIFGFFVGNSVGQAIESLLAQGQAVSFDVEQRFDGWGYLRVLDTKSGSTKFAEVESFATPNAFADPPLPGDYTMHNIVMGPAGTDWANTAFVSWYSDGMIALDASDPTNLQWTGQWIGCYGQSGCAPTTDTNGRAQAAATNFWGVYPTVIDGQVYVLGSDRNNGLVILKPAAGNPLQGGLQPGAGATP